MYRASIPYFITPQGEYFEDYETFSASSQSAFTGQAALASCGTVLIQGKKKNEILTTRDEFHTFVIGETGSGKTRRVVLPTIRLLSKTGESMVITDPKGELYRYTAKALERKGYDVKVINLKEPLTGNRYNPLSVIDRLYHSGSEEDREEALVQVKDLLQSMKERIHDESQVFWENTASTILQGIILLILDRGKEGNLSYASISSVFQEITYIVNEYETKINERRPRFGETSPYDALNEFVNALPSGNEIKTCLMPCISSSGKTRQSYLSIIGSMLAPYCDQSGLQDNMRASDLSFEQLGEKPTALFMIFPDYSDSMYTLGSLYVTQIYQALVRMADKQKNGLLRNKVYFILDEFANFARIPDISSMLTAARSRGIRFTLICQSMEQLISEYTEPGAETMMANCRVWIYMNCRNLPFLNRLVDLCGKQILSNGSQVPLVSVSELLHLRVGEVLVLNDRCRPMRGYLPDYSEYDFGENTVPMAVPKKRKKIEKAEVTLGGLIGAELESDDFDEYF